MATCRNICVQHRAGKLPSTGRYISGQKRCMSCDLFMYWEGVWCPCCNNRLRTGPKSRKYREKILEAKQEQENGM